MPLLDGTGGDSDNAYAVYDTATGDLLATLSQPDGWRGATQIGSDHRSVFLSSNDGKVWEYDVETWEPVRGWQAQNGRGRGLALSPDGSQLASTGEDDFVMIWDLETLTLDDQIPAPFPSDAMWIDESTLGIIQRGGEWVVVPLDDAALLERASAAITRSFTPEECRQYEIEPCPTMEELVRG